MASKKKKKEQEELLQPDPFLESAKGGAAWFQKNIKLVIGAIVLALAGVLGYEMMSAQAERSAAEVTSELGGAVEAYAEATDLREVITSTVPAALEKGYRDAKSKFASFRAEHPNHPSARLAALYEADLTRRLSDHEEAVTLYETYLGGAEKGDVLAFYALEGKGYALEAAGELDGALEAFSRLAEKYDFYADYGLKHKARVLEKQGKDEDAVAAYQAIVNMDPASELKSFAENRLKALN